MQVTIKGTSPTDTLDEGEVRTVELTPYVRNLIRNGLAVQIPRPIAPKFADGGIIERPEQALNQALSQMSSNAREYAHAPAKKTPTKRAAAKKAAKPVEKFDDGGIGSGILRVPDSLSAPERVLSADEAEAFVRAADALADEE